MAEVSDDFMDVPSQIPDNERFEFAITKTINPNSLNIRTTDYRLLNSHFTFMLLFNLN